MSDYFRFLVIVEIVIASRPLPGPDLGPSMGHFRSSGIKFSLSFKTKDFSEEKKKSQICPLPPRPDRSPISTMEARI